MSFNVNELPIPVKIVPNFDPNLYIVCGAILAFLVLLLIAVILYRPRRVSIKVYKHPDGTYRLRYSWGWYHSDNDFGEHYKNIEELEARVAEILEKTEWRNE